MTSISSAADLQRALFAAVRREASLAPVAVYNLALAGTDPAAFGQLGKLAASADFANSHAYAWYWGTPREALPYLLKFATTSAPSRPIVLTETGYTTLLADTYKGVTEDVQAIFVAQTLLDAFMNSVERSFIYELIDEKPDPAGADPEQHFGLFRSDGSPKPAATALHNLTAILREEFKEQVRNCRRAALFRYGTQPAAAAVAESGRPPMPDTVARGAAVAKGHESEIARARRKSPPEFRRPNGHRGVQRARLGHGGRPRSCEQDGRRGRTEARHRAVRPGNSRAPELDGGLRDQFVVEIFILACHAVGERTLLERLEVRGGRQRSPARFDARSQQ